MNNLKQFAKSLSLQLELMDGREKGDFDEIIGEVLTITDFGFMKDDGKEYVAFITKEYDDKFYFGGMVLTEQLKEIEKGGFLESVRKDGLPVLFGSKLGKNKRMYTTVTFFPEG